MNPPGLLSSIRPVLRTTLRSPLYLPSRRVTSPITYAGRTTPVTNTTGLNAQIDRSTMTTAKVGDRLLLIQLSTSTPGALAGYTQLAQITNASFTQIVTLWGKVADSGDLSGTVTCSQAVSGVQQAILLAFRGLSATPTAEVIQTASLFQDTHNPQPIVGATALHDGLALAICCPTGTSGGVSFTASAGWTVPIGSIFNSRLGFAYKTCKANDVLSGTITCSDFADGTTKSWSKATLCYK